MKSVPVLFLDVDGVLNSEQYAKKIFNQNLPYIQEMFDPKAVKLLNTLNFNVVLSAGLRNNPEYLSILKEAGITLKIIGVTPNLSYTRMRGLEISSWLFRNRPESFKKYIILDDDNDFMFKQRDHVVRVDYRYGLMKKHIDMINEKIKTK